MQITINENEMTQAIKEYIGNHGINISNKKLTVALAAGRGANGYSASVEIAEKETTGLVETTKRAKSGGDILDSKTMTGNFAMKSAGDPVVKEAVKKVDEIIDTEAAKDPEPLKEESVKETAAGNDVKNLFA